MADVIRLTDKAYVEMVCSLFSTKLTTAIMGCSFVAVGVAALLERFDLTLAILLGAGTIAALARFGTLLYYTNARQGAFTAAKAGRAERRFAMPYLAFALLFGLFAARAFWISPADIRLLLVGLLFGYGAGVATGISLRPWICIPAALMAIVPTILVTFFFDNGEHWGLGLLTAIFLGGGIETMLRRYRSTAQRLTLEHLLSMVDRQDRLTGLANQLALREHFTALAAAPPAASTMVAIHVVTIVGLDRINKEIGYIRGDELLKAIAERLGRLVHFGDVVARLDGPRFAVVQSSVDHPRLADAFAQEIESALVQPYAVPEGQLNPGVHVGYAVELQRGADIGQLLPVALRAADAAVAEARPLMRAQRSRWP